MKLCVGNQVQYWTLRSTQNIKVNFRISICTKYHSIRVNNWCYHNLFMWICLMARIECVCLCGTISAKNHSSVWQREIRANPEGLGHIIFFSNSRHYRLQGHSKQETLALPTTHSTLTHTKRCRSVWNQCAGKWL